MNNPFDNILFLLQHCIIAVDNNAWEDFFQRFTPLIEKSCGIYNDKKNPNIREDFLDWFPGWLAEDNSRYLQYAYKALKSKIANGEISSSDNQLYYFKNYFVDIIKTSAKSDFFNEKKMAKGKITTVSLDEKNENSLTLHEKIEDDKSNPQQQLQIKEDKERLKKVLSLLEPDYKVPFVLTCCYDFRTEEDIAWISDQCGKTPSQVKKLVEKELLFNSKKKYPISAPFIGALLNIENDTVAQRVCRARIKLRSLLSNR